MSQANDVLFRPFSLGSVHLPNRIVMAPMTRRFAPDGILGEASAAYYRRRAEGGVGLILSEGTVIDRPASRNLPNVPFFYGDAALAAWKQVADEVHAAGGKIGPQLWHTGGKKSGTTDWLPDAPAESPSGLDGPDNPWGKAMSEEDIADTIAAFASAALDAKNLGFDVVEIHGAHGYLIDQFFWTGSNRRKDRYGGGTIRERARFGAELTAAVRRAVGPDIPIIMRVSQWKQQDYTARIATTPDEMAEWLEPLVAAGADVLHCSQRRFWEAEFPEIDGEKGLNFAGWAKKLTGFPTISVGSVGLSGEFTGALRGESSSAVGIDSLLDRMARDEFDLIAIGRALISDPDWPARVHAGETEGLRGFNPSFLRDLV